MTDTTGRIPLWLIGTVTGILVIGLIGIFFYFYGSGWVHLCNNHMNDCKHERVSSKRGHTPRVLTLRARLWPIPKRIEP